MVNNFLHGQSNVQMQYVYYNSIFHYFHYQGSMVCIGVTILTKGEQQWILSIQYFSDWCAIFICRTANKNTANIIIHESFEESEIIY
jgi:hypothetical protein